MAEDYELWDVICDGPYVPTKKVGEPVVMVPKTRKEYNDADRKTVEKNFRAKKILVCGIRPDEYNMIPAYQSAKEIWEALKTTHEGTTQVKQSKIDMLTTRYELFKMKDDESIQDMHTRFTSIINELHSLGEIIPRNKLVRKVLSVLYSSWESKVDAINEAKGLQTLTMDKLQEHFKHNSDKAAKRNPVPDKRFKRKNTADNVVKQALAAWGDSSSKSEEENDAGDSSMLAVESEANEYDSIFTLMDQSDDDEDDDNDTVNFRDVQRNLKSYSPKKLMSLANVLIDAYHSLVSDKDALTIELGNVEQTNDDMVVCAVDLKETIENLKNEKEVLTEKIASVEHERDDLMNALVEKVAITEQERDDLLVVIADLEETIEELKADSKPGNSEKGKKIASEAHIKLENELNIVKTSLCEELEKNRQLQAELEKVKNDLEKSLKWTWSSNAITAMYFNNGGNRQGIGFQREKGTMRGSSQQWIMDSGCSKHMTGNAMDFLSLKALQGGNVSFGNRKKGCILGVEKLESLSHTQSRTCIMSMGNKVEFLSKICTVTNLVTGEVKDLVRGLPNSKFKEHKVCDACARGKHVKSSFKPKKDVSTSNPLELLHMDLCGPMRVPIGGGKRYIFVIVDDYSRFTWTMFLRTKDETFKVFVAFVKKIQVKMESKVDCIRSDHGTEFHNAKFDEFCSENGITHNFSAPRTPQQNGVVHDQILLEQNSYELLNGRKPKLTHLRTFGCKCYVLNHGKDHLGKLYAKSDEGIFLGYYSQSKAYKVYNKRTQCMEKSVHVIFNESSSSGEKSNKDDQDSEPLLVPGEIIDMANGKADMMSQVKETNEGNATSSTPTQEEPGTQIITTEAEERVVDAVQSTSQVA
ncbi:uncharacterized protein LOC142175359 [Nicotiana tabacum]|uniref:Uncharacterized protein LOC142175359 n=1 Tax=Nicotiana tabacum TaxID=4097 RepID=A0AC58TLD8_TOBAC